MTTQNPRGEPHDADSSLDDAVDKLFGGANPNPARVGCPPRQRLEQLARQRGTINDPFYEHLGHCSECYREWQAARRTLGQSHGRPRWWWMAAAAAVIMAVVGAVWALRQLGSLPGGAERPRQEAPLEARAQLDLRPYRVERRDAPEAATRPLALQRGRVGVTIILPVGSDPGRYDIKVIDRELGTHASTTAEAVIRNHVTQLTTTLDLRSVASGSCQLALRREGESWRLYPAELIDDPP